MFEFFEGNYPWNMAVVTLVEEVGTISEPSSVLEALKAVARQPPEIASPAWRDAMQALGERLEREADEDEGRGHLLSASRKHHRAAMYFVRAERMVSHTDPLRLPLYRRALHAYRKARELNRDPINFVEVAYGGSAIPGLFLRGEGEGPRPTVLHLQGFDSLKETQYPYLDGYRPRGMNALIVDQPGAGEALRLNGLVGVIETETYVAALLDYLQGRPDVDGESIGLCGMSMGGFFAPRAAAHEPRVKACAAWGALYEAAPLYRGIIEKARGAEVSLPDTIGHALWTFGCSTLEELEAFFGRMTLEPVIGRLTCPLLVTHGENDRQVPLAQARRTVEEAGSTDKELKVFTKAEGGAEHCQLDNRYRGADYVADWFAERLGGSTSGV